MPLLEEGLRRLPGLVRELSGGLKKWLIGQSVACRFGLGLALCFVLFSTAYALLAGNACEVLVDGQVVAVAAGKGDAKKALDELIDFKSEQDDLAVTAEERVSYNKIWVGQEEVLDYEELKNVLSCALSFSVMGTVVTINGEDKLCLKTREEAQELLDWLKTVYPVDADEQVAFKESVELVEKPVNEGDFLTLDVAKDVVLLGTTKIEQYTVSEGDTAWDIATAFDIEPAQLNASNPGVDTWQLNIGQVLKLSRAMPLLTVVATKQLTTEEEIPYLVEEQTDDNLLPGERKVLVKGTPGQRIVTYLITRENGLEANREVRWQDIISEPSTEVVVKGSQIMLASRGAGRMNWPCGGGIVSPFGKRGGGTHSGIDIGADYADAVAASAGGTVLTADWDGGYGKCVVISHGNGVTTRYAHLSSINAAPGQEVERGQLIGLVGSTGYSTGPHLHFEVSIDGQQRDPVNFLP